MPTSAFHHIPLVCHLVAELQPSSVLDIGVGFGKWGHLFRETLDIAPSAGDPARYDKPNWKVRIDGIEGFPQYVTPMHHYLYDQVHIGDMVEVLKTLGKYDVIFIGDVIEHIDKPRGTAFIREMLDHANKAVILSTPAYEMQQENVCGNPMEDHHSLWTAREFRRFPNAIVRTVQSKILVAALLKEGVPRPRLPSRLKSFARATLVQTLGESRYRRLGGV